MFAWLRAFWTKAPPRAQAEKTVAPVEGPNKSLKVSDTFLLETTRKSKGVDVSTVFAPASPPPFVVPKDAPTLAQDNALGSYSGWAANAFAASMGGVLADGLMFMGYPYLAELAQRPEYRVISETLAGEMTRKWVKFKSAAEEEDKAAKIKDIEGAFNKMKVRELFRKAEELDGFFGRSHIFIEVGGNVDRDEIATPFGNGWDIASQGKVAQGTKVRLQVVEPVWVYAAEYNSTDPLSDDWYKPRFWYVNGKRVHESRLLNFAGREVPDLLKPAYSFGGLSLSQMAKPYVDYWIRTRNSVGDIVFNFSTNVLKTNMADTMSGGPGSEIMSRVAVFNNIKSNQGTLLLDKDSEEYQNVSAPISGLDHLQAQSQEHMSAVSRIPLVKLTGISPSGLNASSEGEIKVFYDYVHDLQESHFRDPLHKLLGIVQLSLFGEVDEDIEFEFLPLEEMSEKEKAEIAKMHAEVDGVLVEVGALGPEDVRKRVANDPDTPYIGLDVDAMPGEGEASSDQWTAALSGTGAGEGEIDPWAVALGAEPVASSTEQWSEALGVENATPSSEQWSQALEVAAE